jgi:hypothetical protein
VKGSMFSSDDRVLSIGEEIRYSDNGKISSCDIKVENVPASKPTIKTLIRFPVEAKSFDYIENLRLASQNKDVILKFEFKIVVIEHNFDFDVENNILRLRNTIRSLGEVNLFKVREFGSQKLNYRIPLSDWVDSYKNNLGFGKAILFEINQPSLDNIADFQSMYIDVPLFKERIEAAISGLRKMQDYLKEGEWTQVVEQFRDIDFFRIDMKTRLQTLLQKTTNLPKEKCQQFTEALDRLYDVSSQFHHPLSKGEDDLIHRPLIMNVNKEDAYFFYMFMLSITQLIIKKIEFLRRKTS